MFTVFRTLIETYLSVFLKWKLDNGGICLTNVPVCWFWLTVNRIQNSVAYLSNVNHLSSTQQLKHCDWHALVYPSRSHRIMTSGVATSGQGWSMTKERILWKTTWEGEKFLSIFEKNMRIFAISLHFSRFHSGEPSTLLCDQITPRIYLFFLAKFCGRSGVNFAPAGWLRHWSWHRSTY